MANKIGIGVEVNDGGAVKKINGISKAFDKLGGKGSGASLFGNVGAKAVAVGFNLIGDAVGGAVGFLEESVKAFNDDAQSQALLATALKNNIPNWNGVTTAVNAFTDAQINLGFSDDDTRASIGQLVGVTHDLGQAMDLTRLAEDLARAKNIDLATATDIVTKAHEGNGKALKSLGIEVQKGATAAQLLDAIQKNVKDSASTWADTTSGKLKIAQTQFSEATEKLGGVIMPALTTVMTTLVNDWLPALGRGWDKVYPVLKKIADILGFIIGRIADVIGWIDKMIKKLEKLNAVSIAIPAIPGLPIPHFAAGGTVPGPLNSPQLIVAHGGETVTPVGGGVTGVTIQGVSEREILDMVERGLFFRLRLAAPTQGRV